MKDKIRLLIESINERINPSMIADEIDHLIIDSLKEGKISIYQAYVINMEAIRLKRLGYKQPAWNERVRISTCLSLLNQKLLAHVFNENIIAEKIKEWAIEAYGLNKEKRSHFIIDRYSAFLESNNNHDLLEELLVVRRNYNKLSNDEGPYHNEVFPYHFYSPEEILLQNEDSFALDKQLDEDIEDLIIRLGNIR